MKGDLLMVRNMDLIREILIQIEAKSTDVLGTIDIEIEGQEHQTIVYHLKLLVGVLPTKRGKHTLREFWEEKSRFSLPKESSAFSIIE